MVRVETDSVEIHNITVRIYPEIDIPDDGYPAPYMIIWMMKNYQIDVVWDRNTKNKEYGSWIFSDEKYTEFLLRWR